MATRVLDALPTGLRYEPTPKRVRAERDGRTVVDSTAAVLVWTGERPVPVFAFPQADVDTAAVPAAALTTYDDPDLAGLLTLDHDAADRWLEEDDEVIGHPRDPFQRVDIRHAHLHVRVELDGEVLAETDRPVLVFETRLPVRYYLPPESVRTELLTPTDTHTICPYKGVASYWTARAGDHVEEDLAWAYPEPVADAPELRDLVAFPQERVRITVDGDVV